MGAIPTWQLLLQPVAIGAAVEATKSPKPSMERTGKRFREQAGRNARERRAGLETHNAGADPAQLWGRPPSLVPGEQLDPASDPAGVVATACLHRRTDATRETPSGDCAMSTGLSRETGWAAWGVGEVHSTGEAA